MTSDLVAIEQPKYAWFGSHFLDLFLRVPSVIATSLFVPGAPSKTTLMSQQSRDLSSKRSSVTAFQMLDCNLNSLDPKPAVQCRCDNGECIEYTRSRLPCLDNMLKANCESCKTSAVDSLQPNILNTFKVIQAETTIEVATTRSNALHYLRYLPTFAVNAVTGFYLLFFIYLLSQTRNPAALTHTLGSIVKLNLDPLQELSEDDEVGSCDFTVENLLKKSDIFLIGHIIGYAGKAVLFRDFGFAWLISVSWELTELLYCGVLPNFVECWWDILIFDVLACNASGIFLGMGILASFKIPTLQWYQYWQGEERTVELPRGNNHHQQQKPKLVEFQWRKAISQGLWVFVLLFFCNSAELNSFTLKRVFGVHKNHPLNVIRLLIHAFMSYGVITNYRMYLRGTLASAKLLPMQFWAYLAVVLVEFATAVKHGDIFSVAILPSMFVWISMLCIGSVIYSCLASCIDSLLTTSAKVKDNKLKKL